MLRSSGSQHKSIIRKISQLSIMRKITHFLQPFRFFPMHRIQNIQSIYDAYCIYRATLPKPTTDRTYFKYYFKILVYNRIHCFCLSNHLNAQLQLLIYTGPQYSYGFSRWARQYLYGVSDGCYRYLYGATPGISVFIRGCPRGAQYAYGVYPKYL